MENVKLKYNYKSIPVVTAGSNLVPSPLHWFTSSCTSNSTKIRPVPAELSYRT